MTCSIMTSSSITLIPKALALSNLLPASLPAITKSVAFETEEEEIAPNFSSLLVISLLDAISKVPVKTNFLPLKKLSLASTFSFKHLKLTPCSLNSSITLKLFSLAKYSFIATAVFSPTSFKEVSSSILAFIKASKFIK